MALSPEAAGRGEETHPAKVDWCGKHGVELRHIEPGKPNQNAFIEHLNRTCRDEALHDSFISMLDV